MSLLAPLFLAGLLAIGLPWWLHRLSSDNPNKQNFSSLMFLEPGEPRRVLAKKVQYLLLLALRIGVLVLLALAFARARALAHAAGGRADGARLHLIVLDGSASMGYGDRWERALAAARRRARRARRQTTAAQLVLAGRTFEVLGPATGDVAVLAQTLNTVEARRVPARLRPADALDRRRCCATAELPVVIDLVTDVQQSGLPDALRRARAAAPGRDRDARRCDGAGRRTGTIDSFGALGAHGRARRRPCAASRPRPRRRR